jgi:sulfite dehydrogenase
VYTRRNFFLLAAAGILSAADREKRDMLVRSTRPEDLEMPLSGFSDSITPVEHFFVRTHVYVPQVNLSEWRLKVEGEVATPLTFTMDDLKKLPSAELIGVLECAGNGRSFYEPSVPGAQWSNGAAGNGRWHGVRLADVLKKAGIKDSAKEILFDGADVPIGTMADFQRSITAKKALDPNTILAYEMNGETLPVKHGFPLRVVAAGWAGDSWIKWLTSIRVLDKEFDGFWMVNAYRHPGKPVAPGTLLQPEQMRPVTSLRVKSVIASPVDGAQAELGKPVTIQGVAWSGEAGPVTVVEVSVDGGREWRAARLAGQLTPFGWRQWDFAWTPQRESYYTVMARARDKSGDAQPLAEEWNPAGYLWNVAPRAGIDVVKELRRTVQPIEAAAPPPAPPARFRDLCLACHQDDMIRQQRLTRAQWGREIDKMMRWGSPVKPEEREGILDYLTANFGILRPKP